MALTDDEKQLVMTSFAKVAPIADTAAELFYGRLFEIAPDTQRLFKETDMKIQGRKLMQTLATAVGALDRLEDIVPDVKDLGRRHVAYGVTEDQYADVGTALIWTLEQGLGDDFDDETRAAWVKVYGILADVATQAYDEKNPVEKVDVPETMVRNSLASEDDADADDDDESESDDDSAES